MWGFVAQPRFQDKKKNFHMFKAIYFDTNIFFYLNFNFNDEKLVQLTKLAFSKSIELWSSDIALTELEVALRNKLLEINNAIKKANGVLENCVGENPYNLEFINASIPKALQKVKTFFHNEEIQVLKVSDLDESDIEKVFRDYFNLKGVFSLGKKRNEFPDAFQMAMILRKIRVGQTIALVSNDADFKKAFASTPEVIVFTSIEQVVKYIETDQRQSFMSVDEYDIGQGDAIDWVAERRNPRLTPIESRILSGIYEHEEVHSITAEICHDGVRGVDVSVITKNLISLVNRGLAQADQFNKTTRTYNLIKENLVSIPLDTYFLITPFGKEEHQHYRNVTQKWGEF